MKQMQVCATHTMHRPTFISFSINDAYQQDLSRPSGAQYTSTAALGKDLSLNVSAVHTNPLCTYRSVPPIKGGAV